VTDFREAYRDIQARIKGRVLISEAEAVLLAETVKDSELHVEVGCLWGGTAILAALAGAVQIYSIDAMEGGFWSYEGAHYENGLTMKAVIDNFREFGVSSKITLVKAPSSPFPILGLRPDTFFIDGDHKYPGCLADWNTAREITKSKILFHDYNNPRNPGVGQVVKRHAFHDQEWCLKLIVDTMALFGRVGDENA